jgi:hypothetical protein
MNKLICLGKRQKTKEMTSEASLEGCMRFMRRRKEKKKKTFLSKAVLICKGTETRKSPALVII